MAFLRTTVDWQANQSINKLSQLGTIYVQFPFQLNLWKHTMEIQMKTFQNYLY